MSKRLVLPATLLASALVCAVVGVSFAEAQERTSRSETATPDRAVTTRIDREIDAVIQRDEIKSTGMSDDEEFLRRVFLDTVGEPPSKAEYDAFMADRSTDKRRKLIDSLLSDPRFGQHMGDLWGNIIVGRTIRDTGSSHLFAHWMSERVNNDDSFRDIIYDIVTADGDSSTNPAVAAYTRIFPFRVADAAGQISRTLTGVQIQCAECHDHPYEEAWTEQVFNGVASFFSGMQVRRANNVFPASTSVTDMGTRPRVAPRMAGDNLPPQAAERLAEIQRYSKPVTLDGREILTDDRGLWRKALAQWMVSKDNKQTARYMANRFWSFAFGSGILNPVDDFNSFNDASHPELLDFLADELIASNYDIKRLYRAILNSRTYQRTSRNPDPKAERWHFASYPVRQLAPEQFFAALTGFVAGPELRQMRNARGDMGDQLRRQAERVRNQQGGMNRQVNDDAVERISQRLSSMDNAWFLRRSLAANYTRASDDDEMTEVDGFTLSIDQALAVMNGGLTQGITSARPGSFLANLMRTERDNARRVDELYIRVLTRKPTERERKTVLDYVAEQGNDAATWEDILFALIATTEFATNK